MREHYEIKQVGTPISFHDELVATTIKFGVDAAYRQITKDLNTQLYGDRKSSPLPTRWQRVVRRARVYRQRVADAWLVLRGKADIGDGW